MLAQLAIFLSFKSEGNITVLHLQLLECLVLNAVAYLIQNCTSIGMENTYKVFEKVLWQALDPTYY